MLSTKRTHWLSALAATAVLTAGIASAAGNAGQERPALKNKVEAPNAKAILATGTVNPNNTVTAADDSQFGLLRLGDGLVGLELFATEDGGFAAQDANTHLAIPPVSNGEPVVLTLSDGARIEISTAARLFGVTEQQATWLTTSESRSVRLSTEGLVEYVDALAGGNLFFALNPQHLKSGLILEQRPEVFTSHNEQSTVYFEETLHLPQGWHVADLEQGQVVRAASSVSVFDASGAERLVLEAPVAFEQGRAKAASAPCTYELALDKAGNVTVRVGISAAWLADANRNYPIVIDPTINVLQPLVTSTDPTLLTLQPRPNYWNCIAVTSAAADWDLTMGNGYSWEFSPACDFLVADGNRGTITSTTGSVHVFSGTGDATVELAGADSISVDTDTTYTLPADRIIHAWEVYVSSSNVGTRELAVNGPSNMRWALYKPASDASWANIHGADYTFDADGASHTVNLSASGYWFLVAFRDGGSTGAGTIALDWTTSSSNPNFDLIATAISLNASSYPVTLNPGDTFSFTREITRTGNQPTGTQIDYSVRLSLNNNITTSDPSAYSYQNAVPGQMTLTGTVPTTITPGTYNVGLLISSVAGETTTSNNKTYDSITDHQIIVVQATTNVTLAQGQDVTVSTDPTSFDLTPQNSFWNLVALQSNDWDLSVGSVKSERRGAAVDFVAANGNNATIATTSGIADRISGSGSATLVHAKANNIHTTTGLATYSWQANQVAHVFEYYVSQTGQKQVYISGRQNLKWAVLDPGTGSGWRSANSIANHHDVGTPEIIDFNQSGWWAVVVYDDGTSSAGAGSLSIDVGNATTVGFDVEVSSVALQGSSFPLTLNAGDSFQIVRVINVIGTRPTGTAIPYKVYLSTDTTFDATDIEVYTTTGAATGSYTAPCNIPSTIANGLYYVGVVVAPVTGESNTANNVLGEDNNNQVQIGTVTTPNIDVSVTMVELQGTAFPLQLNAGDTFTVRRTIALTGTLPSGTYPAYKIYLSTNNVFSSGDTEVYSTTTASLGAGTVTCTAPSTMASGTYYVGLIIDPLTGETNTANNKKGEDNNNQVQIGTVTTPSLDVSVTMLELQGTSFPLQLNAGDTFTVRRTIAMTGTLPSGTNPSYKIYLSTNNVFSSNDIEVYSTTTAGINTGTVTCTAPTTIATGTYYVGLIIDPLAGETNIANNTKGEDNNNQVEIASTTPTPFDLAVTMVELQGTTFPLQINAGDSFQVRRNIALTGTLPSGTALAYKIYLSTNNVFSTGDTEVYSTTTATLNTGTVTCTAPATMSTGTYYVGLILAPVTGETNAGNNTKGEDNTNQVEIASTTPTPIDVAVTMVELQGSSFPLALNAGDTFIINRTITLAGSLPSGTQPSYKIYLSTDTTFDSSDTMVYSTTTAGINTGIVQCTIPTSMTNGLYYVGLVIDPLAGETNIANNTLAESNGRQVQVGTITVTPFNIEATSISLTSPTGTGPWGSTTQFVVDRTITVTGTLPAAYTVNLYASTDNQLSPILDVLVHTASGTQVSGAVSETFTMPGALGTGNYFLIMSVVPQTNETSVTDNVVSTTQAVVDYTKTAAAGFDLGLQEVRVATGLVVAQNATFTAEVEIANYGAQDSPLFAYAVYVSTDAVIDASDTRVYESASTPAIVGSSSEVYTLAIAVPSTLADGTYYVGALVAQMPGDGDYTNAIAASTNTVTVAAGGSTTPPVTAAPTPRRSSGGGGCALDAAGGYGNFVPMAMLLALMVLIRRRGLVVAANRS